MGPGWPRLGARVARAGAEAGLGWAEVFVGGFVLGFGWIGPVRFAGWEKTRLRVGLGLGCDKGVDKVVMREWTRL